MTPVPIKDKLNVIRGTLDVFILRAVSGRPVHGFEISLWLEQHSRGVLAVDDSALYQALHRLEARGLIGGRWATTEKNRRARYYRLTAAGRRHLTAERDRLASYARTITALLNAAPEPR